MLALVGIELLPQAVAARRYLAVAAGAGLGGMAMLAVSQRYSGSRDRAAPARKTLWRRKPANRSP